VRDIVRKIYVLEMELLNQLKTLAARRGVNYFSLMREFLWQGVKSASAMSESAVFTK